MTEFLDVVDENNKVIGEATPQQVYDQRLNHRIVHVLVFNDKGEIFLYQRAPNLAFCPGHWHTSAGGLVQKGEDQEHAAMRILNETLNIDIPIIKLLDGPYDHYKMRKFCTMFRAISKGPFTLNPNLAMQGSWFSIADVKDMVKKNQLVHPELAYVMEQLYP
ncbi:NUDIX domain-containing protein [Candidatus Woesearchaeota archaeon]|nr:NUDIX domain-containing protein [Candidatus Woesearchaeota archaeon]